MCPCSESAVQLTAADAHTAVVQVYCRHNSSSPPVQGEDGEWSVGRVLERDILSDNTLYQDMLREGRKKGLPVAGRRIVAELEQEIQYLQENVSVSHFGEQ